MISSNKIRTTLKIVLAAYIIAAAVALCIAIPRFTWDPSFTLKMTDNGFKNIPFNHYAHPKPSNLNFDEYEFVTWWTPGQFTLPLLIEKLFSVKLIIAIKILTGVCLLISGLGIFKLYNKLIDGDAPASTTTWGMFLFTLLQPFFLGVLTEFDGGGILMLTYCPWFIYRIICINQLNPATLLLLIISGFTGFFLKASFTCIFAAAIAYLTLAQSVMPYRSLKNIDLKKLIKTGLLLGLIFVVYFVATKVLFLNHNRNIADSAMGMRLQPRVVAYPIAAPFIALFGLISLDNTLRWLVGCVVIVPLYYLIFKSPVINLRYKYLLGCFAGVMTAFFTLLYFINVDVSYEYRHFVILSVLITPALFLALSRGSFKYAVVAFILLFTIYNVYCNVRSVKSTLMQAGGTGYYSGVHLPYPAAVLRQVHELDEANPGGNDIFYFKNAEPIVALEIRKNRVLLEHNYVNFHFGSEPKSKMLYHGYNSGQIYVVYPDNNFRKDSIEFLTRFEKYKQFKKIYQADGYSIYKAIPAVK